MNELQKQEVYKRVNKELQNIKPENLNNELWDKGHAHTMGYSKPDNTELYDMVSEDFEEFQDLYYEWHSHCSRNNATGKNEDFNEHIEEYYPNIDEDEKWNIAHDWVDEDGFTYGAYISYITELVEENLEEIKEEQFEKDYEVYKNKLKTIKGLEVEASYLYDNYGYKTLNGLEVWTYDDDEYGASNIEKYIEWTSEDGWDYDGFDTFKELFNYIKSNMKKGLLVA
jgi:hypothetical protein